MTLATILLGVALIAITVISSLVGRARRQTAVTRFSRRFGLDVPPGMEDTIRASVQARGLGAPIGTALGVTLATVLLLLFPGFPLLATWWTLFGGYLVGATVGATIAIFIAEGRRERGVVRVARPTAVTVGDYVPPFQSLFGILCVVTAVVAFAGDCWLAVSDTSGYLSTVSGILAGVSVVTLVAYLVVAHRVVGRGALAGTSLELAWDDALRSFALVNFNGLVALIALYSLVAYNSLVATATRHMLAEPVYGVWVGVLPIAASFAIFALVALMSSISSRQHFLRRLWPVLAEKVASVKPTPELTVPTDIMGTR